MKNINRKKILKEIENKKDIIKEKGVKKIGLFGSFIKEKQNKKSDIDILIEFDEPNFEKYAEMLILLENLFKRKIDLVIESDLKPELKYVKKEAIYVKL